jgi:cytoskeleton protein RodZ
LPQSRCEPTAHDGPTLAHLEKLLNGHGGVRHTWREPGGDRSNCFEIGNRLREARIAQGLEYAQAQAATRIRSRYLRALEDEDFDVLPARAYAASFLREYAEFLGLDGQRFVDEFDARFPEPELPIAPEATVKHPRRRRRLQLWPGAVALTLLLLIAWQLGRDENSQVQPLQPAAPVVDAPKPSTPRIRKAAAPPPRRVARIVLVAAHGRSWVTAHIGSREGKTLYYRTLEQGESVRFHGRRLWIRLGAPQVLDARLNGKTVSLPTDTASVIVTVNGVRVVS